MSSINPENELTDPDPNAERNTVNETTFRERVPPPKEKNATSVVVVFTKSFLGSIRLVSSVNSEESHR